MNGSIFPYRLSAAKTEAVSTNLRPRAYLHFGGVLEPRYIVGAEPLDQ